MFVDSPMTQPSCCASEEEQEQEPSRFQPDAQTWKSTLPSSSLVTEQELRVASCLNGRVSSCDEAVQHLGRRLGLAWTQRTQRNWLGEGASSDFASASSTRCK
jgi:hypothetical protein